MDVARYQKGCHRHSPNARGTSLWVPQRGRSIERGDFRVPNLRFLSLDVCAGTRNSNLLDASFVGCNLRLDVTGISNGPLLRRLLRGMFGKIYFVVVVEWLCMHIIADGISTSYPMGVK